jgi:hypothetical protein
MRGAHCRDHPAHAFDRPGQFVINRININSTGLLDRLYVCDIFYKSSIHRAKLEFLSPAFPFPVVLFGEYPTVCELWRKNFVAETCSLKLHSSAFALNRFSKSL